MARLVSFIVLAAIVVIFGVLFFQVVAPFLLPIFVAVTLVVMFRPMHQWLAERLGGHVRITAGLTTAGIVLIVLALVSIVALAAADAYGLVAQLNSEVLLSKVTKLRHRLGLDLGLPVEDIRNTLPGVEELLSRLEARSIVGPREGLDLDGVAEATELEHALQTLRRDLVHHPEEERGIASTPEFHESQRQLDEMLALLRRIKDDLQSESVAPPAPTPAADATVESALERDVSALQELYADFRARVVGGPLVEGLKLQANPTGDDIKETRQSIQQWLGSYVLSTGQVVGGVLARLLIGLAVLVISLYYFLADGPAMVAAVMRLLPLDVRYQRQLLEEFDRISRAVVLATLLSAVVQGLLAGIGFYVAGINAVVLLTVLTMVMALVPFVGAAAVWGACSLWLLFYEERLWAAVMLAIYGVGVISMADNVIKPVVLHGQSKLHPLLALLSVLGGVRAMGLIGIFVGPMAVAFLQALLNIMHTELSAMSQRAPTLGTPE
ncbi:MAG: AI-2E family transporter [Pirellulales bacterium]